ncbi:MAG TPA: hypothetical protein DCS07_09935 [Bdellovibrionales bacterium]|nr:MAG: hypothetical protein A2Z97_04375 [Bdellovibrionales bacterium GWB1_52_6]OFZ02716.1 MAG: hypothetical protein A2X97_12295 [Bdellovibrionales bacterium GWA1_52_35]OFZ39753.1 MAG: hypothetical protein A2070_01005 [Bdellovibrionales bacterium GWC1_52_8]HAR42932.1 hypothetical protein [Bdellovibrionales bacterium]HCM41614.1 hypothetical protein [Bdellovibrionales bacterium]
MRERPLILIADDDADLLRSLSLRLKSKFDVHTASSVTRAKSLVTRSDYDAAIIDLNFEGQDQDGVNLLDHMNREAPGTFLIVLSGDSEVKRVIEAMRRKHFEFIYKEGDFFDNLVATLTRAAQTKRARENDSATKFLTESKEVLDVLRKADRILKSQTDASILINGETGSGKEFLAKHIALGMKKSLVAANMASIPKETAESILFGHEKGAFTGAVMNKIGLIESANNGIFFLDEIGECSPEVQAKLLRVLQEKEVLPLGTNKPRKINVQFLAATHCDLEAMVEQGRFRRDLLQRLNTFILRLPPLRERPEDILLYTNLFLDELSKDGSHFSVTQEGAQALLSHSWPGNVRELNHVITRIVVLSDSRVLDRATVLDAIGIRETQTSPTPSLGRIGSAETSLRRNGLIKALHNNHGNKRLAAQALGISEATLYRWVDGFGLKTMVSSLRQGTIDPSEACNG